MNSHYPRILDGFNRTFSIFSAWTPQFFTIFPIFRVENPRPSAAAAGTRLAKAFELRGFAWPWSFPQHELDRRRRRMGCTLHISSHLYLYLYIWHIYIYIHLYCIYYLVLYIYTLKYICTYIYIYMYIYIYVYIYIWIYKHIWHCIYTVYTV